MAYQNYIPGNNQRAASLGPAPAAPVAATPYQGIPQQVLQMMQPPGGNRGLFDMLGIVGSNLMAAGAPSLDPGSFGKQMAQLSPQIQQYQRGLMDQKRQAGLFQYQMAQDALARSRDERRDSFIERDANRNYDLKVASAASPTYGPITNFEKMGPNGKPIIESAYRDSPAAANLMERGFTAVKTPASVTNINLGQQSPGAKKADQEYASEWVEWETGGRADAEKSITQLRGVRDLLEAVVSGESDADLTGQASSVLPSSLRSWVNAESADQQQLVEEVVQRNLRLILGAQFTNEEGKRLIDRAYNPMLDESRNLRRINLLINQMEKMAGAKDAAARYWHENGQTLVGFAGDTTFQEGGFDALNAVLDAEDKNQGGGDVSSMSSADLLKSLGLQ